MTQSLEFSEESFSVSIALRCLIFAMINMVLHLYISAYVRSLIMTTPTGTIELKLKYILKFNIIILKNINISDIVFYLLDLCFILVSSLL